LKPPIWNIGAMTPLMLATHRNDLALVQLLVDKKADKSRKNHLGKSAADYAKDEKMKALVST
jgi:ankyrin repeat protein